MKEFIHIFSLNNKKYQILNLNDFNLNIYSVSLENKLNICQNKLRIDTQKSRRKKNNIKMKYITNFVEVYGLNEDGIIILNNEFVEKNNKVCKLVVNNKRYKLSYYLIYDEFNIKNKYIRVTLIKLDNFIIIKNMFHSVHSLISISNFCELDKNIDSIERLFYGCMNLKSIDGISNWNVSNINNIEYLFCNCSSLISLPDISMWNFNNLTNMEGVFLNCISLVSIPNISNWDIKNVESLNYLFQGCLSLNNLPDISKWNISNISFLSGIFFDCTSLIKISDISNWDTRNVLNLDDIFYGCSSLKILPDISKWNLINVRSMNNIFKGCSSLENL